MFKYAYMDIKYRINWLLSLEQEQLAIEPIVFRLLAFIQQKGSLKSAAKQAQVSYRYAWGLLNKWQDKLGTLVILEPGRGAHLSTLGETLLNANAQLNAKFSPGLDNFATECRRELNALLTQNSTTSLNIYASHGLAVSALRQLMNQQSDFKLDLHFHGSLESLHALHNKQCDIAGFHIPIGPLSTTLLPRYLDVLNPATHDLIYVVKRNQGLMYRADNLKDINSIQSLKNQELRFINRQENSGTRLLFDQLIASENIKPEHIKGYDHEEFTHLAVAALVASGAADISFGIAPMAEKFNLEFIPLIWEHYCLAVPKSIVKDDRVLQIIALLQSDAFKQSLANTRGYQTKLSGQTVSFDSIFA